MAPASPPPRYVASAVVFDMDGLLLNTEHLARRALRLAGEEMGLDLGDELCALMIGVPADGCRRLLLEHYGEAAPADRLFDVSSRHLLAQIDGGAMRLQPGVSELLAELERAKVPHAVATSSSREKALHHLERAGIAQCFDAIVTRDDVERGKPSPDLYLRASDLLQTAPADCLALEDSYNGVRAAHAAGMPVIMVPDLLPPTDEMRQLSLAVLPDLHAVRRSTRFAPAASPQQS
jgi:HAD superfamily hydrolase (TIGR01509 family)